MLTSDFDFDLPRHLIALRPTEPRDAARLLVVREDGRFEHCLFRDLPNLLARGDTLAFNDSKVIPARLMGQRLAREPMRPDIAVEVMLIKRTGERFRAFCKPARRLRANDTLRFAGNLEARVMLRDDAEIELIFDRSGSVLEGALAAAGTMPLPPYIAKLRAADPRDNVDYQTVYARHDGSVAAPTAGLHFTHSLLGRLAAAGIGTATMTLHVGAGTFLPVSVDDTKDHVMHAERALLSPETADQLNHTRARGGRICAVGTTSLRTIESAAVNDGQIRVFDGDTDIFITPGYRFRAVNILLTNFHLPRSTLFMLVCAFHGTEMMKRAYAEAIRERYRFYSYGDACLLFRSLT